MKVDSGGKGSVDSLPNKLLLPVPAQAVLQLLASVVINVSIAAGSKLTLSAWAENTKLVGITTVSSRRRVAC